MASEEKNLTRANFYIDKGPYVRLKAYAKRNDQSASEIVRQLIAVFVDRFEPEVKNESAESREPADE